MPKVVETVHADGNVSWYVEVGSPYVSMVAYRSGAVRSPLTGAWFVWINGGPAVRRNTLRGARGFVLGGNGKRYGGHSSVTSVHYSSRPLTV